MSTYYDKDRDNATLGKFYTDHVSAMTREGALVTNGDAWTIAERVFKFIQERTK